MFGVTPACGVATTPRPCTLLRLTLAGLVLSCCVVLTQGWYHWMSAFTSRLNEDIKLVGSTISCEGSPLHGKRSGRWRRNPHVQSYAVATDQVGLAFFVCRQTE